MHNPIYKIIFNKKHVQNFNSGTYFSLSVTSVTPWLSEYIAEKAFKQLLQKVIRLYPKLPVAGMSEQICFADAPVHGT